ncbi:MAG: hypothetical protein OEL89_00090 [Candidatus Peregrinibacteria bacterium]|nr:hypothetical protein [Candidatus Peregrinibacteria bacterium]
MKNVILLSMERHGCSEWGAIISEIHKQVYDEEMHYNYEISRVIAIDDKYNLPRGYSTVYYVKPQWLLKRKYDKIIILQRDLISLKEKMAYYYFPKLKSSTVFKRYPDFEKKIEFYYELVFDEEVRNDPRVHWVYLDDLNNYTVATFSLLLDFLEFPRKGRPVLIPINPRERDWNVQGTILRQGHGLDPYQKKMIETSGLKITTELKDVEYTQYVNVPRPNPYKLSPEEWEVQKGTSYRIRPELKPDVLEYLNLI